LVEDDQQEGGIDDMEDMYNQIKEEASEMEQSPEHRNPSSLGSHQ
jgi:hypothetical protein